MLESSDRMRQIIWLHVKFRLRVIPEKITRHNISLDPTLDSSVTTALPNALPFVRIALVAIISHTSSKIGSSLAPECTAE